MPSHHDPDPSFGGEYFVFKSDSNLDALGHPDDALPIVAELDMIAGGIALLRLYATKKREAMIERLEGRIENARRAEEELDCIYRTLPEWARSW